MLEEKQAWLSRGAAGAFGEVESKRGGGWPLAIDDEDEDEDYLVDDEEEDEEFEEDDLDDDEEFDDDDDDVDDDDL